MKIGTKSVVAIGAALMLAGGLAACSPASDPVKTKAPSPSASKTIEPSASATEEPSGDYTPSGSVLKPGDRTTGAGVVPFLNYDDQVAEFEHKLVSVEKAPQADVDAIVAEVPQAAGLDIYYLKIESHYVSGADLAHSSFSTSFNPVDADGNKTQSISLIGWDNCPSGSIPNPGNDPATVIVNCVAGVSAPGGSAPTGVAWSQYDTDYDSYDGSPAFFYLP